MVEYDYLYEYLPIRYTDITSDQEAARYSIYALKDGCCPESVKEDILHALQRIVSSGGGDWIVAFLPASSKERTLSRWSGVEEYLSKHFDNVKVDLNAITNAYDVESGHLSGKKQHPTESFSFDRMSFYRRNVILIDDIITRGTTFGEAAEKVLDCGANSVYGLFIGKTTSPEESRLKGPLYECAQKYGITKREIDKMLYSPAESIPIESIPIEFIPIELIPIELIPICVAPASLRNQLNRI